MEFCFHGRAQILESVIGGEIGVFIFRRGLGHKAGAEFPKGVDGDEDGEEGERVAGGCDESGQDEDGNDSVFAIFAEESPTQQTHLAEEPSEEGQLKDHAHQEDEGEKVVHIGVERNQAGDLVADSVLGQEANGQGQDEEVADENAEEEHEVAKEERPADATLFALVKSRLDKGPQ